MIYGTISPINILVWETAMNLICSKGCVFVKCNDAVHKTNDFFHVWVNLQYQQIHQCWDQEQSRCYPKHMNFYFWGWSRFVSFISYCDK